MEIYLNSEFNVNIYDQKVMKIKVTLMTENDKHLNETYTKEKIEEEAVKG